MDYKEFISKLPQYHNDEIKNLMWDLAQLRGSKTASDVAKKRRLKTTLRNYGILSLPFSMNPKRELWG